MLEDLAKDRKQWPFLAELIRSEQVPENRLADLSRTNSDFWAWPQQEIR